MKLKTLLIGMSILLFFSCNDDFLELEPITEIPEELIFSNVEALEPLLLSAYRPLGFEYIADLTGQDTYTLPFIYTDARSDDSVVENYFFGGNKFHDFETLVDLTPSNTMVRAAWIKFFTGVARANEIIGGLRSVDTTLLSQDLKDGFLSEARFLRGYYYFEIVKNFGAAPIFDGIVDASIKDNLKRRPVAEVYEFIEADLQFASEELPTTQGDKKRATQGAALGLLSKVYLYQEKWQEAADASKAVVDLGIYDLEPNFADNFKLENEFGIESIFEIDYDDKTAFVFQSQQTSSLALQLHAPSLAAPLGGWNYNLVTPELQQVFEDEGDFVRRQASIIMEGDDLGSELLTEAGQNPLPIGFTEQPAGINDPNGGTQYGVGYAFTRKFFLTPEEIIATSGNIQHSPLNQKIMRYSEVLLIHAEAVANGASGDGQGAFDAVRQRVGLDTKPLSIENIKLERRLELAFEWNRFHDLVRWKDAANEIEGFTSNRDELLPIPFVEIQLTGKDDSGADILTQNSGY